MARNDEVKALLDTLMPLVNGGDDACLTGKPLIPIHKNTLSRICGVLLETANEGRICGYPIPGWRLDHVQYDVREKQPDGWIVSLARESPNLHELKRSYVVMARSDIGPLEAWDEALKIARREDQREAERKKVEEAYGS